jgi:uncharacterized protein (TIGR02453 family)
MTDARPPAPAATVRFTGFDDRALEFYSGLEADNSRSYWEAHKAIYEQDVKAEMLALLGELEAEFGAAKLFRPHRDVRFSKDKSPYKTAQGAVLRDGEGVGALYLQVNANGLLVGGGYYQLAPDQLARYRAAVAGDVTGAGFAREVADLLAAGFTLHGEQLSRAPRGFPADHPRADLLRHKGIAAMVDFGAPDWLATPRCRDEVAATWRRLAGFNSWLAQHVGASTAQPERR